MPETRKRYLASVRSMVIKLGTQLLTGPDGQLDNAYITRIAEQVAHLRQRGISVTIVSSGAVGAGLRELNIAKRPDDLAMLQAVAAVGQRRLMDVWAAAFSLHQLPVAQILLTREDINSRQRYLNLRNTLQAIHRIGAIPILNENDTVSTDEIIKITFGDNDILAATVTRAVRADLLVLLTVVDGMLDEAGQPVRLVENLSAARQLVRVEKSALGKGGMNSKLEAAAAVTGAGEAMLIAHGRMENVLVRILDHEPVGTLFVPSPRKKNSRSRWIGSVSPRGTLVIDDGAARAIAENNKSLLPAGIVRVEGTFDPGDCVAITRPDGTPIARGLCNYGSKVIEQIRGKKSREIKSLLGEAAYEEAIHRDNLVVG